MAVYSSIEGLKIQKIILKDPEDEKPTEQLWPAEKKTRSAKVNKQQVDDLRCRKLNTYERRPSSK